MKILVTGTAGFIGFFVAKHLLERGDEVVGIDNINEYYSVKLKYARLKETGIEEKEIKYGKEIQSIKYKKYRFIKMALEDRDLLPKLFETEKFDKVIHLAAQAGVRYSIENPWAYIDSNIVGFTNILECCRFNKVQHLVYASSSSVYGENEKVPFSETDKVDNPISLYAATKKSNELMASCYSKLYDIPITGLRFFTVYGPWGRPDMAPMLFLKAIMEGKTIDVFNNGNLSRDFTYIDDIVKGVVRITDHISLKNNKGYRHEVYNIGCSSPVKLMDFIETLERVSCKKAQKVFKPMQQGDVYKTYADTSKLETEIGYKPKVQLLEGIEHLVEWWNGEGKAVV
ncbi:MAG: NAD-dependent epimerase [Endomicrobium sp.]|jgi:UDP-glucuronate 4-epimerase|nr:NAD-dependent epimerase [Endomicrobium sp.]